MSHNVGRHRAPERYNPLTEIGTVISQTGTPLAKGSAVLAASGGLVATFALPAHAADARADWDTFLRGPVLLACRPEFTADPLPVELTQHLSEPEDLGTVDETVDEAEPDEIVLPVALLPGLVPEALESALPARLKEGGALIVQARPGRW